MIQSELQLVIENAIKAKWCTKLFCTTCSSLPFRSAVKKIEREKVILGLKGLDDTFLSNNLDMFLLITHEIAFFPTAYDVLLELGDSPAAKKLKESIEYENKRQVEREKRATYDSEEEIAKRKLIRKENRILKTEPHRLKKIELKSQTDDLIKKMNSISDKDLILSIRNDIDSALWPVFGGIFYHRLLSYYKKNLISESEKKYLNDISDSAKGYWLKMKEKLKVI